MSFKFIFTGFCYWIFFSNKKHSVHSLPVKFGKSLWGIFVFLFKIFPNTMVLIQITLLYSYFLGHFFFWCRTCEWSLLLQFPNYCKTGKIKSCPYLIPTTPRIHSLLSENVIAHEYNPPPLPPPKKKSVNNVNKENPY